MNGPGERCRKRNSRTNQPSHARLNKYQSRTNQFTSYNFLFLLDFKNFVFSSYDSSNRFKLSSNSTGSIFRCAASYLGGPISATTSS